MKSKSQPDFAKPLNPSTLEPLNPSTFKPSKEGWRWVKLGEVCEIIMGQSPPGSTYNNKGEGLPFFQGKADFGEYFPTVRVWCSQPIKIVDDGDILISVRAPVGPVNMNNVRCCIGRGLAAIKCDDRTVNWFIFWYLRSIKNKIASLGSGSTFGAITRDDLIELQIPLPLPPEQHRIASKLQELMQCIERARTACEKQLEAAKALPSAYLREVFESEEAKKWERKKLGEVIKFSQSGIWGNEPTGVTPNEDIFQVLRSTEIDHNGYIDLGKKTIAYRQVPRKVAQKYYLEPNDLLIVRAGGTTRKVILGRVGIFRGEANKYLFSNFLLRVRVDESMTIPDFLWFYLNWSKFLEENIPKLMRRTTGIQNLPIDEYFSISIPLPPIPEQHRIASYLKKKMSQVEKLRTSIEKQLEAINALPQVYLKKAFKGEL